MGGSSSSETKTIIREKVEHAISLKITNVSKTVNTMMSEVTNKVTNSLVNEIQSDIKIENSGANITKVKSLVAKGPGSVNNLTQEARIKAENLAAIKILTDSSIQNEMATKMANELLTKIQNDNSAKQDLMAMAAIKKKEENEEGFGDMIGKVTEMAGKLFEGVTNIGKDVNESNITDIEREITAKIETEMVNDTSIMNDIRQKFENVISTEIKNMSKDSCNFKNTATNTFEADEILAEAGGVNNSTQVVSIDAVNKCIIDKNMTGKALQSIVGEQVNKLVSDNANTNSQDAKLASTAENTSESKSTDAVAATVKSVVSDLVSLPGKIIGGAITGLMMPIIIIVALVITVIVAFKLVGAVGGSSPSDSGSGSSSYDEQEGGAIISGMVLEGLKVPMIVLIIMLAISSAQNKQVKTEQTVVEKQIEKALS